MLHKDKATDTAAKTKERGLQKRTDFRGPWAWFEEMDRWFEDFRREFESRFWGPEFTLAPWREETGLRLRTPLVDVVDAGREFLVKAELPGVAKEDLDLSVTPEGLELRAETKREREEKDEDYYYRERVYGGYRRALSFPEEVLPDQAEATLKDGVLEVRVPKKAPAPKREPVKVRVT